MSDKEKLTSNEFKKEMTVDEKKAQRAAKAAEKKARAEAAAAKKALQPVQLTKTLAKISEKPAEKLGKIEFNTPTSLVNRNVEIVQGQLTQMHIAPPAPTKSALKTGISNGKGNEHEVKFGLTTYSSDEKQHFENEVIDLSPISYAHYTEDLKDVHPAFITLVQKCDDELIINVDELARAFFLACSNMFSDFYSNNFFVSQKYDAASLLKRQKKFMLKDEKWSLPPAFKNLINIVRKQLLKIDENLSAEDTSAMVLDELKSLENDYINVGNAEIINCFKAKLVKAKRVVVYGGNKIIEDMVDIFLKNNISVYVVDDELPLSKRNSPGFSLAKLLAQQGVKVSYSPMSGIARILPFTCLAVLPSSAVFLDGGVSCPKGSVQLALVAKTFNVPVVVTAHVFKFVNLVQHNKRTVLLRKQNTEIVPADLVTALFTDIRIIPPSSAPAVVQARISFN